MIYVIQPECRSDEYVIDGRFMRMYITYDVKDCLNITRDRMVAAVCIIL